MTPDQNKWYFNVWRRCRKLHPDWKDTDRKDIVHVRALGIPKSSKDIDSGDEFTAVIAELMAIAEPTNYEFQKRAVNMRRKNKMAKICQTADIPYIAGLLKSDRFNVQDFDALSDEELHHFLITCADRAPSKPARMTRYELESAIALFSELGEPEKVVARPRGSSPQRVIHDQPW